MGERHFVIIVLLFALFSIPSCGVFKNDKANIPEEDQAVEQTVPAPPPTPEPIGELKKGIWGNARAQFHVSNDGARLNVGCSAGVVPSPIELDQEVMFEVPGTYRRREAIFWGHVDDDMLRLIVSYVSDPERHIILDMDFGVTEWPVRCR
ncbi:MAG: hypothetical protein V4760_18535 [Bdellovibrionota bacterium]